MNAIRERLMPVILAFVLGLTSCAYMTPTHRLLNSGVATEVLCPDLVDGAQMWRRDVAKEYPNALIIAVHGGVDPKTGEWYAYPTLGDPLPVDVLVKLNQLYYPGRHIVLICCNPEHIPLTDVHNVTYAPADIWVWPDDAVGPLAVLRDFSKPSYVGRMNQFIDQE